MKKRTSRTSKGSLSKGNSKWIFPCLILFIAIVGLVNALRFGAASVEYYSVKNVIEAWQLNAKIQTKDEFEQTKMAIYLANTLHSSNPLYMDSEGLMEEWGGVSGFQEQESLFQAKAYYLESTKVRPLWPITWANLAMIKWRLQEFDDEMFAYLKKADALGPQSFEVHILFSRLGISLYEANHPMYTKIKDSVHTRLRLGLRNVYSKEPILSFMKTTDSFATVCRWMPKQEKYSRENQLACAD